jgi:hypothetical protein
MEITNEQSLITQICEDKESYQKQLSKLSEAYEALESGVFNDSILKDIKENGIQPIITNYLDAIKKDVDGLGIKSPRMKSIFLQSSEIAASDFTAAYEALLASVAELKAKRRSEEILSKQLIMTGYNFEKRFGWSNDPGNLFKNLTIGINSWVAVEGGKSWGFEWSDVRFTPGKGDIHLYAKCPVSTEEKAKLVVSYEPLPNTPKEYLVLLRKGAYEEINY